MHARRLLFAPREPSRTARPPPHHLNGCPSDALLVDSNLHADAIALLRDMSSLVMEANSADKARLAAAEAAEAAARAVAAAEAAAASSAAGGGGGGGGGARGRGGACRGGGTGFGATTVLGHRHSAEVDTHHQ